MIRPFQLHRPASIAEAVGLLGELGDAAVYAGGTELLQIMKMGFARFAHLVDLKRIDALRGIGASDTGEVRIGAATTHHDIERSFVIRDAWPAFVEMERHVANPRVRSVGTIGGNLCFAEPHSDPATVLLALDARLEMEGPAGRRSSTVDDFLVGALTTDLGESELLTAIVLPARRADTALGYRRMALTERPTASVACRLTAREAVVSEARLVVGSVGDRPVVATAASEQLVGTPLADLDEAVRAIAPLVGEACEIDDEPGASAEYRRHLAGVLAGRAVRAAAAALA